jgi:formamidopyrimidine-DNA glycosylase
VPELPEVETVVRDLRPHLVGRRIRSVEVGQHRLRRSWTADTGPLLVGQRIHTVHRRGKWILFDLDEPLHLGIHLGMTGQLTVVPAAEPRADHTHVVIGLNPGKQQLRFRDIRRFGCTMVFPDQEALDRFFVDAQMGPEPFNLKRQYWRERLAATARCLKAVLLDQRVVAGVGNIYADESLFEARLHPTLLGRDLEAAAADRLRKAVVKVLNRAIDRRGSSIRNYVGGSGLKGEYQREFRVYGRAGEPCPRCRSRIERIRLAGRSTHFCPQCQKSLVRSL